MTRLQREIESYNGQLEKVQSGERPVNCVNYVMTTAANPSREDAIAKARVQANEIKALIGSALNVSVIPAVGDDMKKCFEWEYALPEKKEFEDLEY